MCCMIRKKHFLYSIFYFFIASIAQFITLRKPQLIEHTHTLTGALIVRPRHRHPLDLDIVLMNSFMLLQINSVTIH